MKFKQFNERFFNDDRITWYDREGIVNLGDTNAVITLVANNTISHLDAYYVDIVHKKTGHIATQRFLFNSYFSQRNRIDTRSDISNQPFYVWDDGVKRPDWYIAIPSNTEVGNLATQIMEYIKQWWK